MTWYADDLTVRKTVRSVADVEACHELIRAVLASLKDHKLVCYQGKCYILAKFAGKKAASIAKQYTAWTKNEAGEKVKLWRIGKTKHFPAFRWVPTVKFLGMKASYGPFEMQTLTYRISEAKQKLRQVRKFVYNGRVASTMSRLRVWQSVVWPTLAFGLAEVGLSLESAKSLRAWYAFKIRSVLNKPAHVTHMTTSELYEMYSIEDPVSTVPSSARKMSKGMFRNALIEQSTPWTGSLSAEPVARNLSSGQGFSRLLSGACPKPQALKELDASKDSITLASHLESLARAVAAAPRHQLPNIDRRQDSKALLSQCLQCGFWTPDYTKLKSHVRKVHAQLWDVYQEQVSKTCGSLATHTPKGLKCSFCGMQVHKNQHCLQCPVMFQVVLEWHRRQATGTSRQASTEPQQVSIQQAFQGPASRPGSAQPASDLRVLLNKANSCYI